MQLIFLKPKTPTEEKEIVLTPHGFAEIVALLTIYSKIIVYFSGGKDSLACVLRLLELGVPREKIELWHHLTDGREGSTLMDWPVTPAYCQAIAHSLGLKLYFSWKVGGFEGEMLRENARTQPTRFETPDDIGQTGGTRGKCSTRCKFPQVSANLSVRWCSAYLKIDVASTALRNQKRFNNTETLTVSGERAEESAARSKYKVFEPDRTDNRNGRNARHVDRWRPVHQWSEAKVWEIIERWKINPHPAYRLGWGRVSCLFCIFGSDHQWASARQVNPVGFDEIILYEGLFETTIHRKNPVEQRADKGTLYQMNPADIKAGMSTEFNEPVFVEDWQLPSGAYGESCGPS